MSNKKNTGSKLQGVSRLITDATIGVTDLVESMHNRIVHPPLPSTPIQHLITNIAGVTYKSIRWSTRLIGGGVDSALGLFDSVSGEIKTTDEREAINSVLNGVIGDYLEKTENPLEIDMQFRYQAKAIPLDEESRVHHELRDAQPVFSHDGGISHLASQRREAGQAGLHDGRTWRGLGCDGPNQTPP